MNAPRHAPPLELQIPLVDLKRGFDQVPLEVLARTFGAPLELCPRSSCSALGLQVFGDLFACHRCGAMGAGGSFYLFAMTGWTFDELHDALEACHG